MFLTLRQSIACVLVLSLSTQAAFAARPQTNFWEERQQRSKPPLQLAALPASMVATLNDTVLPAKQIQPLMNAVKSTASSSPLALIANEISPMNATVQEVYNSGVTSQPPVVIMQDVHLNVEAQGNLAAALGAMMAHEKIGAIGVEGAFDRFDFAPFRGFSAKTRHDVAQSFLNQAKLAAPSYAGIVSSLEPPLVVGVDDRTSYRANVQAYLDSRSAKVQTLLDLTALEQSTHARKLQIFSTKLRRFDDLRTAYQNGSIKLGTYIQRLAEFLEASRLPLSLNQFVEASKLERQLNFTRIDQERRIVLAELTKKLDSAQIQELIAQSVAYREGKVAFGTYYRSFRELCANRHVDLNRTPMFNSYIQYVLLTDGIKANDLFGALETIENDVQAELATTQEGKNLLLKSEALSLAKKLVGFELSAREWERYKTLERPLAGLLVFEGFYTNADLRSQKMVENLLNKTPGAGATALIVGGFHTPAIAQKLRSRKTSYLILSPKITKLAAGSSSDYLSIFAQQKTPLEKLFHAEKLFINPTMVNVTEPDLTQAVIEAMKKVEPNVVEALKPKEQPVFDDRLEDQPSFFAIAEGEFGMINAQTVQAGWQAIKIVGLANCIGVSIFEQDKEDGVLAHMNPTNIASPQSYLALASALPDPNSKRILIQLVIRERLANTDDVSLLKQHLRAQFPNAEIVQKLTKESAHALLPDGSLYELKNIVQNASTQKNLMARERHNRLIPTRALKLVSAPDFKGGRILWLRALIVKKLNINPDWYDHHLVTIENTLSMTAGIVFTAAIGSVTGLPLESFWTNPVVALGISFCFGWILFVAAHIPGFNSGRGPPEFLRQNVAIASMIAGAGLVFSFVPLALMLVYPNLPHSYLMILIVAEPIWGWFAHRWINQWTDDAFGQPVLDEPKRGDASLEIDSDAQDALIFDSIVNFLRKTEVREIHDELWAMSPTYRSYFAVRGKDAPAQSIKRTWQGFFKNSNEKTVGADFEIQPDAKIGGYTIGAQMGRGGSGAIHMAIDEHGNSVVVKTIRAYKQTRLRDLIFALASMRNEARLLQHLNNQDGAADLVPKLLSSSFDRQIGHFYLAMTTVPGLSLTQFVKKRHLRFLKSHPEIPVRDRPQIEIDMRIFTPKDVLNVLEQLTRLHDSGVVNGDISPGNIMLFDNHGQREFRFLDFGAGKFVKKTLRKSPRFIDFYHTQGYTSPTKQTEGLTPSSDVNSLCQVLLKYATPEITNRAVYRKVLMLAIDPNSAKRPSADQLLQLWRDAMQAASIETLSLDSFDNLAALTGENSQSSFIYGLSRSGSSSHSFSTMPSNDDAEPAVEDPLLPWHYYAPLLEWVIQLPLAVFIGQGYDPRFLITFAVGTAVAFATLHKVSLKKQILLGLLNFFVFSGTLILPGLFVGMSPMALALGLTLNIPVHYAYNVGVLAIRASHNDRIKRFRNRLPLASIATVRKRSKAYTQSSDSRGKSTLPRDMIDVVLKTVTDREYLQIHKELMSYAPAYSAVGSYVINRIINENPNFDNSSLVQITMDQYIDTAREKSKELENNRRADVTAMIGRMDRIFATLRTEDPAVEFISRVAGLDFHVDAQRARAQEILNQLRTSKTHLDENPLFAKIMCELAFQLKDELPSGSDSGFIQKQLIGGFGLLSTAGKGGFGVAYKARHQKTKRVDIVKVGGLGRTVSVQQMILNLLALFNEARILREIKRKKITDVAPTLNADYFDTTLETRNGHAVPRNRYYLRMELIDGETVERMNPQKLTVSDAIELFEMLARLHAGGIAHGDIKPENIMTFGLDGEKRQFRFIDFGAAALVHSPLQVADYVTTPGYSPIEKRSYGTSPASDVFALANVVFQGELREKLLDMAPELFVEFYAASRAIEIRKELESSGRNNEIARTYISNPITKTAAEIVTILKTANQAKPSVIEVRGNDFPTAYLMSASLWTPKNLSFNKLKFWEVIAAPVWEETLFTLLALATGQREVYLVGRLAFVVLHALSGKPNSMWSPLAVSIFVSLIIGAQTGFDFSSVSFSLLMKIYAGAIAAHVAVNGIVTSGRDEQYRNMANALLTHALAPAREQQATSTDLLAILTNEKTSALDEVFNPRNNNRSRFSEAAFIDTEIFSTVLRDVIAKQNRKILMDPIAQSQLLRQLALVGVAPQTLDAVAAAFLKNVSQLNVMLDGSAAQQAAKLNALREMANKAGRADLLIYAFVDRAEQLQPLQNLNISGARVYLRPQAALQEGVLMMDRLSEALDTSARRQWISGLRNARFVVPAQFAARFDVSVEAAALLGVSKDELLRNLTVAFIDDMLQVRVLNGSMLEGLDKVARAIMTAA